MYIMQKGFTLIELLVVVAILGILAAVAIPMYVGYIDTARVTAAQNGLRTIYAEEQAYFGDNNSYYATGAACADDTSDIHNDLFDGKQVLDDTYYYFCITQGAPSNFTAQAVERDGARTFTINEDNDDNF
jgi:prepilin-type N-terminal cleavage/methylation domain-containing protein